MNLKMQKGHFTGYGLILIIVTIIVTSLLLGACSSNTPAPTTSAPAQTSKPATTAAPAPAGKVYKFSLATFYPTNRQTYMDLAWMCDYIRSYTNGQVDIQAFPDGGLGLPAKDFFNALKSGALDIAQLGAQTVGDWPMIDLNEITFYPNVQASILADSVTTPMKKTELAKHGIYQLCTNCNTEPSENGIYSKDKFIMSIADMKGVKIRVWNKEGEDSWKELGATPVMISMAETYTAMQTGVCDTILTGDTFIRSTKLWDVVHYASIFLMCGSPLNHSISFSKKAWDSLPPDLQKRVQEAGDIFSMRCDSNAITQGQMLAAQNKQECIANGVKYAKWPDSEMQSYLNLLRTYKIAWAKKQGGACLEGAKAIWSALGWDVNELK